MALGSIVATTGLASVGAAIQATTSAKNATNAAIVVMSTSFLLRLLATFAAPGRRTCKRHPYTPSCRLQLVCHLAVSRRVQTEDFLLLRHAQANGDVDNLEDDPSNGGRERSDGHHGNGLLKQLPRVAVEKTIGAGRVDRGRCEEAGRQRTPDAANAVDGEDIERVIDPDVSLQD